MARLQKAFESLASVGRKRYSRQLVRRREVGPVGILRRYWTGQPAGHAETHELLPTAPRVM